MLLSNNLWEIFPSRKISLRMVQCRQKIGIANSLSRALSLPLPLSLKHLLTLCLALAFLCTAVRSMLNWRECLPLIAFESAAVHGMPDGGSQGRLRLPSQTEERSPHRWNKNHLLCSFRGLSARDQSSSPNGRKKASGLFGISANVI